MQTHNKGPVDEAAEAVVAAERAAAAAAEGGKATYWDIMQRARSRGEIAMGFANLQDRTQTTCTLNPDNKDEERVWPTGTVIVVITSD